MRTTTSILGIVVLTIGLAVTGTSGFGDSGSKKTIGNAGSFHRDILSASFGYGQEDLEPPIEAIYQGCPARDCIPSIDRPKFVPASDAEFLHDDDLVLAISHAGLKRAYPTRILDRHEIVNDWFGDVPVLVTWCPLCGSGLAFYRALDGEPVEFGVSGLLHNSDLVMYDRETNSLWQQITGKAIAGPKRGKELEDVPANMTRWAQWRAANPSGQVLKPPRSKYLYEESPYGDYARSDRLMFPVSRQDARLDPKRVVFGVKVGDQPIAIDADWLSKAGRWRQESDNGELVIELDEAGGAVGTLGGEPIAVHRMFWFAWYSFNPDTTLISGATDRIEARADNQAEPVDFALPSLEGEMVSLSDYRGQWLVLNYWATWCGPCRKEIPELSTLDAQRQDINVLGLAYEDTTAAAFAAFLEDFDVSYPILLVDVDDPPQPFGAPPVLPMTHVLNRGGRLVKTFMGPVTREAIEQFIDNSEMTQSVYSDKSFLELVEKYADENGNVDYQAWKDNASDMVRLDRQVERLAEVSPDTHPEQFPDRAAERSYWINAYNMLVVDAVLEHWPLESVRDVNISFTSRIIPGKGFFYDRKVVVGGQETNLWDLEKKVLRKQKDPRLHFALNCASSSCPVLRPWEWTDEQLDRAARDFVNDPANVAVRDDTVYLSPIFKWYRKDFPENQLAYLQQYAVPSLKDALQRAIDQDYPRKYVEYDWDLNDAEPTRS